MTCILLNSTVLYVYSCTVTFPTIPRHHHKRAGGDAYLREWEMGVQVYLKGMRSSQIVTIDTVRQKSEYGLVIELRTLWLGQLYVCRFRYAVIAA
jgi:hypothetical protein